MSQMEWADMEKTIQQCPEDVRYRLQPKLEQWIEARSTAGLPVPAEAHALNGELRDEAIEAQFDNLPV